MAAEQRREVKFQAEGIVCSGCAEDMQTILRNLDGIESAEVNFAKGTISIRYDPEEIEEEIILEKVKSLGFKTKMI